MAVFSNIKFFVLLVDEVNRQIFFKSPFYIIANYINAKFPIFK